MIPRHAKAAFYALAGPAMRFNGLLYRRFRAPTAGIVRVHLGPGQHNYLPDWINVDANAFTGKCDLWTDLRYPLPFHDDSLDAVYSHHMIEHLPDLDTHFREVFRCLKPGGWYRVGGPSGDSAIRKFLANDHAWFGDWPDHRKSIGGRFENFIFCRGEHVTILTSSFLKELMGDAGFVDLRDAMPARDTCAPGLFGDCLGKESETDYEFPHTVIVEGAKPAHPA